MIKNALVLLCIFVWAGKSHADILISSWEIYDENGTPIQDLGDIYFDTNASGSVLSLGYGSIEAGGFTDPGLNSLFAQMTPIGDNSGSWSGVSFGIAFDYTADIAALPAGYSWAGFDWYWNGNILPVLATWDCDDDRSGSLCNPGYAAMQNDVFTGFSISLYGVEVVPISAAVWLFGSGILLLIGVARRKQA
jgi:hypothetical protein